MTNPDNINAVIETAIAGVDPNQLAPGGIYGYKFRDKVEVVDLTGDEYMPVPSRKTGTTNVRDIAAFAQYHAKHHIGDVTEVYADLDSNRITAVLDAHGPAVPGWRQHRLVLTVRRTRNWQTWMELHDRYVGQVEFAEHIEANLPDIVEPDGADLLELAQTFQATNESSFKSGTLLQSGARELQYTEQVAASGGRTKSIEIPKGLTLALKPFEDNEPLPVTARFRYRIKDGSLLLGYILDQPEDVLRAAFDRIIGQVEETIAATVMRGTPA